MISRFVIAAMLLAISACMAPTPAPTLNLNYTPGTPITSGPTMTIEVVKPLYTGIQPATDDSRDREIGPDDTIADIYKSNYAPHLQDAIQADFGKILKLKGLTVTAAYNALDDLLIADKQKTDLVAVITFDVMPQVINYQKITHYPTGNIGVTNEGTVQFIGSITIDFIEPLSKERVVTKKIDVTSFAANTPIAYEDQKEAENNFTELLNTVYPRLMAKVEKAIKTDELLAASANIRRLKEKNQPAPAENKKL